MVTDSAVDALVENVEASPKPKDGNCDYGAPCSSGSRARAAGGVAISGSIEEMEQLAEKASLKLAWVCRHVRHGPGASGGPEVTWTRRFG